MFLQYDPAVTILHEYVLYRDEKDRRDTAHTTHHTQEEQNLISHSKIFST